MNIPDALNQLRNNPIDFLRHNLLYCSGPARSEIRPYYFGYSDLRPDGLTDSFNINTDPITARRAGDDGISYRHILVNAVRMVRRDDGMEVHNIEPYFLGPAGPDLMVTGQLNGCTFCATRQGGNLFVAHLQPGGAIAHGAQLGNTIRIAGRFSNGLRIGHVFGIGREYRTYAYVIGVRHAGAWRLYGQKVNSPTVGTIEGVVEIAG